MSTASRRPIFTVAALTVVTVLMGIWYYVTPLTLDDLRLCADWREYILGQNSDFDWSAYKHWVEYMAHTDSFRLFNILSPIVICFIPHWIFSITTAAAFISAFIISMRLIGVDLRQSLLVVLLLLLIQGFLPWYEFMNTTVFALNYVWPLLPTVAFIYLYVNNSDTSSAWSALGLFALAIATGLLHELITCSVSIGIVTYHLASRKPPTRKQFLAFTLFMLGGLTLIIVEILGKYNESVTSINPFHKTAVDILYPIISQAYLTVILALAILIIVVFRLYKQIALDARSWCISAIAIGGVIINIILPTYSSRIYFFTQFFSIIAIGELLRSYVDKHPVKLPKIIYFTIYMVGLGVLVWHFVAAIDITETTNRQIKDIEQRYIIAGDPNRFYPITTTRELPVMAWGKGASAAMTTSEDSWRWHGYFYGMRWYDYPIPLKLQNIVSSQLKKIPGNSGIYDFNGYWIKPFEGEYKDSFPEVWCVVKYDFGGLHRQFPLNCTAFCDTNGKKWLYLFEERANFLSRILKITELNLL